MTDLPTLYASLQKAWRSEFPDIIAAWLATHDAAKDAEIAKLTDENQRLAARTNALVEVIRGVVSASRPNTSQEERDRAWRNVRAIIDIENSRTNHDFIDRLELVRVVSSEESEKRDPEGADDGE